MTYSNASLLLICILKLLHLLLVIKCNLTHLLWWLLRELYELLLLRSWIVLYVLRIEGLLLVVVEILGWWALSELLIWIMSYLVWWYLLIYTLKGSWVHVWVGHSILWHEAFLLKLLSLAFVVGVNIVIWVTLVLLLLMISLFIWSLFSLGCHCNLTFLHFLFISSGVLFVTLLLLHSTFMFFLSLIIWKIFIT